MMSAPRLKQLMSGLTATATRVYDVVPHDEDWTAKQIFGELARQGRNMDFTIVQGCLDSLRQSGLINETKGGFRREPVRRRAARLQDLDQLMKDTPMPEPRKDTAPPVEDNLIDKLGALSQRVAALGERHRTELRDLAQEIADTAIEVQVKLEQYEGDLTKFRQFQALLKGL